MSACPTFEHRFLTQMDKGIGQGHSLFLLHGDGLDDFFLMGIRDGCLRIAETLKRHLLRSGCEWFVHFNGSTVSFFQNDGQEMLPVQKTFDDFSPCEETGWGADSDKDNASTAQAATTDQGRAIESEVNSNDVILAHLREEMSAGPRRVAVFFEGFDWLSQAYSGEQNLKYIQFLQAANALPGGGIVVASMPNPEFLKETFHFAWEDGQAIRVSRPADREIAWAWLRITLKNKSMAPEWNTLLSCAAPLVKSSFTLRQSATLLRKILREKDNAAGISVLDVQPFANVPFEEEVAWAQVILPNEIKAQIMKAIDDFQEDTGKSKGILLGGPPGTGKTMIAKALAREKDMFFLAPTLAELKAGFVGQSAPKVKELFDKARAHQPTIIFLDEADTLFPRRGGGDGDSFTNDMVNEFLVQLDGAKTGKQRIFVIAASNRCELIDPAVVSRLGNEAIEIGLPDEDARVELFEQHLAISTELWDEFWEKIGFQRQQDMKAKTEGMSGRDIKNISERLRQTFPYTAAQRTDTQWAEHFFERSFRKEFSHYFREIVKELRDSLGVSAGKVETKPHLFGIESLLAKLTPMLKSASTPAIRSLMATHGLTPKQGALLYGQSGCGKTQLVSHLACEHGSHLVMVESKQLLNNFHKNMDTLVDLTLKLACLCAEDCCVILFIDEFDAVAGDMALPVRGTLLKAIERLRKNPKVVLLAATNFKELIDEATVRSGRFDLHLEVRPPDAGQAVNLMRHVILENKKFKIAENCLDENLGHIYDCLKEKLWRAKQKDIESKWRDARHLRPEEFKLHLAEAKTAHLPSAADLRNAAEDILRFAFAKWHDAPSEGKTEAAALNTHLLEEYVQAELVYSP